MYMNESSSRRNKGQAAHGIQTVAALLAASLYAPDKSDRRHHKASCGELHDGVPESIKGILVLSGSVYMLLYSRSSKVRQRKGCDLRETLRRSVLIFKIGGGQGSALADTDRRISMCTSGVSLPCLECWC